MASGGQREPVRLKSDAPSFATVDELVAASDLVVATVTDVATGRAMTAAGDPSQGRSTL